MKKESITSFVSLIEKGDQHKKGGERDLAIASYLKSFDLDPNRREGLMRVADIYYHEGKPDHVIAYVAAALQVSFDSEIYTDDTSYYEYLPHEYMYWALWQKGEYLASKKHFDICMGYLPFSSKYLHDFRYYYELPKITIVASNGVTDALATSTTTLNYPSEKIELVNEGDPVEKRTGEWLVYIDKDYSFEPDCLMAAFKQAMDNKKLFMEFEDGLEPGSGNGCMISKKLLDKITKGNGGGTLWEEASKLGHSMRCGRAKITKTVV